MNKTTLLAKALAGNKKAVNAWGFAIIIVVIFSVLALVVISTPQLQSLLFF